TVEGRTLTVDFQGPDTNYFHGSVTLPAEPSTGYRMVGEVRTMGLETGQGAGFQIGDARGWEETRSCSVGGDVKGDADWTTVTLDYTTLEDAEGITVMARRLGHDGGDDPVSGTAQFRLVSLQRFEPWNPGAVPDVSVNAATREDGSVTLMIVNTNLDEAVPASIVVEGMTGSAAQAWSLVGPQPWSHNSGGETPVELVETPIVDAGAQWSVTLPRHSLTAVEVTP
ncbi:MAG: hypothetical protein ACP5KN_19865, partial [Armatimonadota bacterium]